MAAPASGAVLPFLIVHARVSSSPVVKKVIRPNNLYASTINLSKLLCKSSSFLSSSLISIKSSSSLISIFKPKADFDSLPEILKMYKIGLSVSKCKSFIKSISSLCKSHFNAVFPDSSSDCIFFTISIFLIASLSCDFTSFSSFWILLFIVSKSANINSASITLMSFSGSILL